VAEQRERSQAEAAQGAIQVGRAHGHPLVYSLGPASPFWQAGHQ
jgi:hypothetical protein